MDDPLEQSLDPLNPGSHSSGGRDLLPQQMFSSSERVAQQVGEFWIRAHLGKGAMGQVFLVEHMSQGGMYALKLLPDEMVTDEESLARFSREAKALKILGQHPAIVTVYGTGRTKGGSPYYVMDYVEGRTLKEAFKQGIPLESGLDIIDQVGDALAFAHTRNLIHRDLKPENVLLTLEGRARLVDFGLVRAITQGADAARLTQAGQALGTPAYMAPEQTSSEETGIGPWTDVWGLGVLAYETITQQTPYSGTTPLEIYTQLYEGAPIKTPRALGIKLKPKLEAVIMKALAHQGSERYPDAGAFLSALREVRKPATDKAPAPDAGPDNVGASPPSRGRALLLAVVAIVSIALMGGALMHAKSLAAARKVSEAALTQAEGLLQTGDLRGAEAEFAKAHSAKGDAKLQERYAALESDLAAYKARATQALEALEALYAEGRIAEARERYTPGLPASPNTPWVLALTGDYAAALRACPPKTHAATKARLAAWAGELSASQAALEALPGARSRALAAELRAYLPTLEAPQTELKEDDPWSSLARVEEALAHGDLATALISAGEQPEKPEPDLVLSWTLARGRLALALGDRRGALEACEAINLPPELHPLERGRALAWRAYLSRLSTEPDGQDELARYAPGVPLAKALRGEPSPWWGAGDAARRALASGDVTSARAALTQAGASRSDLLPSPLSALRSLAARGQDGATGLLVTRATALIDSAGAGPSPQVLEQAAPLLELALTLRPNDPLTLWAQADLARARGREIQVSAEAVQAAAKDDPVALLLMARSFAAEEEAVYLRWLSGQIEGSTNAFPPGEGVLAAHAKAAAAGGPLGRTAQVEQLEVVARRHSAATPKERPALRQLGLGLANALLKGVDLGPVLQARASLAKALRAGDAPQAEQAASELGSAASSFPADALRVLQLRSQLGDAGAPDAARAYLALAGELPAYAELRARVARNQQDALTNQPRLEALSALVPNHGGLIVAREAAGLSPAAPRPFAGSVESLISLAEALVLSPEHTRFVLRLLRTRSELLAGLRSRPLVVPGRPLVTHLALALRSSGELGARGTLRLQRAREVLAATSAALSIDPAHPAAHILRADALSTLPSWARKRVAPELSHSLRCARAALPWAAAPLLTQLLATDAGDAAPLLDELLAQGFVSRKDLGRAVFGSDSLSKHRPALSQALDRISSELKPLVLRRTRRERIVLTGYELSVRAYLARLPLTSLSLRLRTGADVMFDFASVESFQKTLPLTIPDSQPGQRARVLAEYRHGHAQRIGADPALNDLNEEEQAEERAGKGKLWNQRAAQSLLEGLADRPLGARLRLPDTALSYLGPVETLAEGADYRDAVLATQPESRELWQTWLRRWDPTPLHRILHEALPKSAGSPLSAENLASPYGFSQGLLWAAQRPSLRWAQGPLSSAALADELVLLYLRNAAFDRSRTPSESIFWTANSNLRLHDERLDPIRATLARDVFRAGQVVTTRPTFFKLCEADALADLAAAAKGPERQALAQQAVQLTEALKPSLVASHLESHGSALWRVARAKALAGDAAGARDVLKGLRGLDWGSMWGLRQSMGNDPAADVIWELLPGRKSEFGRYTGEGDDEDAAEDPDEVRDPSQRAREREAEREGDRSTPEKNEERSEDTEHGE